MTPIFAWVDAVHPAAAGGSWAEIKRGGSDRQFWRGGGAAEGLVAVCYGTEKAENAHYAGCAEFLRAHSVSVPRVLAHGAAERFLLLEDAGEEDLWAHRGARWETRRDLYRKALRQAAAMHACDLGAAEAAGVLQAPFDDALYRWEQDYFTGHFLRGQADPGSAAAMAAQAEDLASRSRVLLHRDFQSQNIMVRGDGVILIDFQGMRAGLAGYDLASLLYDPYVPMTAHERAELSAFYAELAGRDDAAAWEEEVRACARQRLMQALGAYGFLGRVKGRRQFLSHIPVAAERLAALCDEEDAWRPLARVIRRAATAQNP